MLCSQHAATVRRNIFPHVLHLLGEPRHHTKLPAKVPGGQKAPDDLPEPDTTDDPHCVVVPQQTQSYKCWREARGTLPFAQIARHLSRRSCATHTQPKVSLGSHTTLLHPAHCSYRQASRNTPTNQRRTNSRYSNNPCKPSKSRPRLLLARVRHAGQ